MWESTSDDTGYITSEPQVGVLPDGSWKVFVGNGVDSPNGTAAMIMIDLASGQSQTIETDSNITNNGLGGVTLMRNSQGQVIGAYAGDLKGNLWRFEWNTVTNQMSIGYSATPLFSAQSVEGHVQPIMAAPLVVKHPQTGQLVIANTGKLLYARDSSDTTTQSAYGIWDRALSSDNTLTTTPRSITRSDLLSQFINGAQNVVNTVTHQTDTYYTLTANAIDWGINKGWVLDLVFAESGTPGAAIDHPKALYAPILVANATALINALRPAGNEEACDNKGAGYAMIVDLTTGGKYQYMQLDTNGDGRFDNDFDNAAGFSKGGGPLTLTRKVEADGGGSSPPPLCTDGTYAVLDPETGKLVCFKKKPTIPQVKDRIWRQLLNPPHP
jgi:type IV pilus assembly protein PilY1